MVSPPALLLISSAVGLLGCGIEQLTQGGKGDRPSVDAGTDAAAEPRLAGAGCGVEGGSGVTLCVATSACPRLLVDTKAFPHCGFRIKGGASELVCGCGESLCSMGTYATCAQAENLMRTQTEQQVCTQVADSRCSEKAPAGPLPGSSGSSTCDRQCLKDCGSGGGCASICGC